MARVIPRPVHDGRRHPHQHERSYGPREVASWFACPTCQRGRPLVLTATSAVAISTILITIMKGEVTP